MRIAATTVALVGFLAWSTTASADSPHAHIASTDLSFDGPGGGKLRRQTVPVTVDDGWTLTGVEPPWDISRGGQRDDATRAAVTVAKAEPSSIAVAVSNDAPPGSYVVAFKLEVTQQNGGGGGAKVDINLTLKVAAPMIDATKQLEVVVIDSPTPILDEEKHGSLVIREKSTHAGLVNLSVVQEGDVVQDGKAVGGKITFKLGEPTDAGPIAPGSRVEGTVTASNLALGSADATLRIDADGLNPPVVVPVHITHRLGAWALLLVLGVGIAIGRLVRVWAQKVIDVDGAAASANEALDALREILPRCRPPEQQLAAEAARKIRAAANKKDKAAIDVAVAASSTALSTIDAKLAIQVNDLRAKLVEDSAAFGLTALPPVARALLERATTVAETVERALMNTDVAIADIAMGKLKACLAETRDATAPSLIEIVSEADRLAAERPHALAQVRGAIEIIKAKAAALSPSQTDPVQALIAADDTCRAIDAAIRASAAALETFGAAVDAALDESVAKPISNATVIKVAGSGIAAMIRGLHDAIATTYSKVREVVATDEPLANGEFLKALQTAAPKTDEEVHLRDQPELLAVVRPKLPAAPTDRTLHTVADIFAAGRVVVPGMPRWVVNIANCIQHIAVVAMLALGGWYLYGVTFVGTPRELLALGATGFFTDVSFASASALFSKLKRA